MYRNNFIKTLDDCFECYGKDNLVPISYIRQQLFYVRLGIQPVFMWESEKKEGQIVAWFLKSETHFAKKRWDETRPATGRGE
jgi:hypothetical protein